MKKLYFIFLISCFSCKQSDKGPGNKVLDFGVFTIEVPNAWSKVKTQGIDSYVGRIAIDSVDTLQFDLGQWSNPLTEGEPLILNKADSMLLINSDGSQNRVLVEDRRGIDPDKYKKQALTWEIIDKREAKIVFPRKTGDGITGVYIDSLWERNGSIDKFNLYGTNLKPQNEQMFLEAIKTIKFHSPS